jgi:glycosyltransferase involved in cell wall biosynthesis
MPAKTVYEGNDTISDNSILNKVVLMACTHPYWSVLQVGSQHLARQFACHGWQVHYVSAPISPVHMLKLSAPEVLERFKFALCNPTIYEDGKIYSYIPFSLIAPDGRFLLRSRPVIQGWHNTMVPALKRLLTRSSLGESVLLYIDNVSYHFLLDVFPTSKTVFRVMDMHERFPGWKGRARMLAKKIATRADFTVYSARSLKPYVDGLDAPVSLLVTNGVDFDTFATSPRPAERPAIIRSIPDPIVIYTGTIDLRIDFRLLRAIADLLPRVSFVFVGPLDRTLGVSDFAPNAYFTGPVAHIELPALMNAAKVGLIPFDVNKRLDDIRGIRPLKLFEYLAAGIPVISARWPEIEELGSPAWFYDNEHQLRGLIYKAIHHQEFDPVGARNFAAKFDWRQSFKLIIDTLEELSLASGGPISSHA